MLEKIDRLKRERQLLGESALVPTAFLVSELSSWRAGVAFEVVVPTGPLQEATYAQLGHNPS